jgi:TRAP-type C4-dicarboxylate transport system permease small subunit
VTRILDRIFLAGGVLAGVFLVLIAVLVVGQIVSRLVGAMIPSADEFAGYCLSAASFLGLAYALRNGAHIRVTLLAGALPERPRWVLNLAAVAVSTAMVAYFTWYTLVMVWESYVFGDVTSGLVPIPLWLPQTGMAIGLVLFTLALVELFVRLLLGGPRMDDPAVKPEDVSGEHAADEV